MQGMLRQLVITPECTRKQTCGYYDRAPLLTDTSSTHTILPSLFWCHGKVIKNGCPKFAPCSPAYIYVQYGSKPWGVFYPFRESRTSGKWIACDFCLNWQTVTQLENVFAGYMALIPLILTHSHAHSPSFLLNIFWMWMIFFTVYRHKQELCNACKWNGLNNLCQAMAVVLCDFGSTAY